MKIVLKPVTAIAVFHCDNDIPIPYKFKYYNEKGNEVIITVGKLLSREKYSDVPGPEYILYDCQSKICGVEKRYTLKYFIEKCQWQLYKI